MIPFILYFALGICSLQLFSELPTMTFIISLSSIGILALLVFVFLIANKTVNKQTVGLKWNVRAILKQGLVGVMAFVLGLIMMWLQVWIQLDKTLPPSLENKPILVRGIIDTIPEVRDNNVRFEFTVTYPLEGWPNPGKLRLFWPNPEQKVQIGEEWALIVKLKRPRGFSNPGSFDKEKHFFRNRWVGEGTVKEAVRKFPTLGYQPVNRLRVTIVEYLNQAISTRKTAGLLAALLVGITTGIDQQQWILFRDTGTAHLMAISGLHVGFVSGFFYCLMNGGWRLLNCPFAIPAQWIAAWVGLAAAFGYTLLAGLSVPTQRALIMLILCLSGFLLRRQVVVWRNFCIALVLVLLVDPFASLMPGFWLSFGAVGLILYGMQGRLNPSGLWWKWGRAQWVAFFGLIPLSIGFFQQFSWVSPIVNLIAIPWIAFLVVPTALISLLILPLSQTLSTGLLSLAETSLEILLPLLEYSASFPKIVWISEAVSPVFIVCAGLGSLIFLAPRGFPGRWLGLVWCLPLFLAKTPSVPLGMVRFTLLDVGQGLAAVLETQHHVLIFDTGPKKGSWDSGERVILPFLALNGHHKIDRVVISHGDLDHIGGLEAILKKMPVEKILTSEPEKVHFDKVNYCYAGQHWEWDGVRFEMLHPDTLETRKRNDHSCVLRVSAGRQSVLLTGDIEAKSELKMIERAATLKTSVLVVPHHGSRTSSTAAFINAVQPRYALFPVGYFNPYGHPKSEVVARYQAKRIELLDSVRDGCVSFLLKDEESLDSPEIYRKHNKRFWHADFKTLLQY